MASTRSSLQHVRTSTLRGSPCIDWHSLEFLDNVYIGGFPTCALIKNCKAASRGQCHEFVELPDLRPWLVAFPKHCIVCFYRYRIMSFATYPDLKDKVALVMGVGQTRIPGSDTWGNGAAMARLLAYSGAKVVGCDLSLPAAEYTASRIREEGGVCDVMQADVTSSSDVQKVADAVVAQYGRIDILINNVGATATGDPATMPEELWEKQLQINLTSVYLACHVVLPIMEKQGSGVVINNASIAGMRYIGKPQVAYSSAKAAVIHFTKVTAVMYAPKGVRLNSIAPGLMYTPLVESLKTSGQEEAYNKIMQQPIPMGRMGDAIDVANATAFLASDAAKYITGHNLVIDGGFTSSAVSVL